MANLRLCVRVVVVVLCVASAPRSARAQDLEFSLAGRAPASTTSVSADPGSYALKIGGLLPAREYTISIQHHVIAIPPIPVQSIPFFKASTPQESATAAACPELRAAAKALADATQEAQVPGLTASVQAALDAGCADAAATSAARALIGGTSTTRVIQVNAGEETVVEVQRGGIDSDAAVAWTLVLKGPARGQWNTTYGVAIARDGNQRFFTSAAADGKFTVTRERRHKSAALVPAVYFSWMSAAAERGNWAFSPTVGFGATNDAPALLLGWSATFNRNLSLTGGGAFLRETRLNGRYSEGQVISENLGPDQVHEKVWTPAWTFGITIRFASNPFTSDDKKTPAPVDDKPAAAAVAKKTPAKPAEEQPASDREAARSGLSFSDHGYRLFFSEGGAAKPESAQKRAALLDAAAGATDVFVMSHGWWNSPSAADCRYQQIVDGLRERMPASVSSSSFKPVFVGIYWPSVIFPTETGDCEPAVRAPRGAETNVQGSFETDLSQWAGQAFPAAAAASSFAAERDRFVALLGKERRGDLLTRADAIALTTLLDKWRRADPAAATATAEGPGQELFSDTPGAIVDEWIGSPAAGAAESSTLQRALNLTNVFTFWTMKERAGVVGSSGVYELVRDLRSRGGAGLRIHLIGHSFGGRLVSAAVAGPSGSVPNQVDSLIVLEGAFSHFAFSSRDQIAALGFRGDKGGLFEPVVKSLDSSRPAVRGRLVAVFSKQDQPNQVLYPLASRIKGSDREAARPIRFGSIGADGFQGPQVRSLRLSGLTFAQLDAALRDPSARLINVDASDVVLGHSDLIHDAVFDLIWASALAARLR